MSSCIFACVKNEELYLSEWLFYHLELLYFDNIVLYDTSPNFSLKNTSFNTDNRVKIFHKPFTGDFGPVQVQYINEFVNEYKNVYKWAAIIDIDEFIVLKKHDNINTFLNEHLHSGSLGINWVFFGNNGHEKYSMSPVVSRFTKRGNLDKHIKCICVLKDVNKFLDPHHASLLNGNQKNEKNKEYNISSFQYNSSNEIAQINHYIIKSREEFNKRYQGHHTRSKGNLEQFWNVHNQNKHSDLTAYYLFYKNIYHTDINKLDYLFYIKYYHDLLINGIFNYDLALNHFKNNGLKEKRITNLNFDYNFYKNNHTDLKNLNNTYLWHHFKFSGLNEKRKYKLI
jgi:hypothetical protein